MVFIDIWRKKWYNLLIILIEPVVGETTEVDAQQKRKADAKEARKARMEYVNRVRAWFKLKYPDYKDIQDFLQNLVAEYADKVSESDSQEECAEVA